MIQSLRCALIFLAIMTLLLGGIYPAFIWTCGVLFFPTQANGSLIYENLHIVGSSLIGQNFESEGYFWGRISTTPSYPYNAQNSGTTHVNADHPELIANAKKRIEKLQLTNPPIDLVTTSASGLDPHISPQSAFVQVPRIAKTRQIDEVTLRTLIENNIERPTLGFLGQDRVNVLRLNIALDKIAP